MRNIVTAGRSDAAGTSSANTSDEALSSGTAKAASQEPGAPVDRIVVVGCGGFIGSHLLDRLLAVPQVTVEGWDMSAERIRHHLDDPRLDFHLESVADACASASLDSAVRRADVVINLAAICRPAEYNARPVSVIRSNFTDAASVVERCAHAGTWLLHFSTSEVYGRTLASYASPGAYPDAALYELDEDLTPLIMGPIQSQRWTYACAKQLLERLIVGYSKEDSLLFTIVRPLNVFGPAMDFIPGRDGSGLPRVLASFMGALLDGSPLRVVDGGTARRTIVSIHDVVDAVMLMITQRCRAENQIFNIGNRANEVTVLELADLMRRTYAQITGDSAYDEHPIEFVSGTELYGDGYEDCDRRMPKLDKASALLGWVPKVALTDVLQETMTSYHEQYSPVRELSGRV
jgi:UDP-apiose/xylose synthase